MVEGVSGKKFSVSYCPVCGDQIYLFELVGGDYYYFMSCDCESPGFAESIQYSDFLFGRFVNESSRI